MKKYIKQYLTIYPSIKEKMLQIRRKYEKCQAKF